MPYLVTCIGEPRRSPENAMVCGKSANVVISHIWLCFPVKLVFPGNAALYGVEMYSRVVRNKK